MHLGAASGVNSRGGRALNGLGGGQPTKPNQTTNAVARMTGSETAGAKLRRREGKSPDRQLRSLIQAKWERMWDCPNSQEVGLEAATL